jgi:hypothetical protein
MKIETAIIGLKLFCVFGASLALSLGAALAQWSNAQDTPSVIQWIIIIVLPLGSALTTLGAFLSSSFGNFVKNRKGIDINGNGQTAQTPKPNEP